MYIDHELTHNMIAGLSFIGDGARLIVSYNESPEYMQDNKPHRKITVQASASI